MTADARLTIGAGEATASGRYPRESTRERGTVRKKSDASSVKAVECDLKQLISDDKELRKPDESRGDVGLIEMAYKRKGRDFSRRVEHIRWRIDRSSPGRA